MSDKPEKPIEEFKEIKKPEIVEETKKPVVIEEVKKPEVVCPQCPECGGDTAPTLVVNEIVTEFCCKKCGKRTK